MKTITNNIKLSGCLVGYGIKHKDGSVIYNWLDTPIHNKITSVGLDWLLKYRNDPDELTPSSLLGYHKRFLGTRRVNSGDTSVYAPLTFCAYGSNNTSTVFTDTALKTLVSTYTDQLYVEHNESATESTFGTRVNSYGNHSYRVSHIFPQSNISTTVAEIGWFGKENTTYYMFSRVVLQDPIQIGIDDQLIVTYELTETCSLLTEAPINTFATLPDAHTSGTLQASAKLYRYYIDQITGQPPIEYPTNWAIKMNAPFIDYRGSESIDTTDGLFNCLPYMLMHSSTTNAPYAYAGVSELPTPKPDFELINATVIGSLTETDGVYSGFSDANYISVQNLLNNVQNSFEIQTAIKLNAVSTSNTGIMDTQGIYTHNLRFTTSAANTVRLRISTTGSETYPVDITGSTYLIVGTKYYIKLCYNSVDGYTMYTSIDGLTWTLEGTSSVTTKPYSNAYETIMIGDNAATGYVFNGSIYLDDTYITVDGTTTTFNARDYDESGDEPTYTEIPADGARQLDVTPFIYDDHLTDSEKRFSLLTPYLGIGDTTKYRDVFYIVGENAPSLENNASIYFTYFSLDGVSYRLGYEDSNAGWIQQFLEKKQNQALALVMRTQYTTSDTTTTTYSWEDYPTVAWLINNIYFTKVDPTTVANTGTEIDVYNAQGNFYYKLGKALIVEDSGTYSIIIGGSTYTITSNVRVL